MTTHKKHIYILAACLLIFTACEKEKDDIAHSGIIGTWEWIVSCGGYTGGCWYPNEDHQKKIAFTTDNLFIQYVNGTKQDETMFSIKDTTSSNGYKAYRIQFSEWDANVWFSGTDTLNLQRGDFVESYGRVK